MKAETGDKGITESPKKVRKERSYKKEKGSRGTCRSVKDPIKKGMIIQIHFSLNCQQEYVLLI